MKHYVPCPECNTRSCKVICIKYDEYGRAIRRKFCLNCKHRWYTVQYPEALIESREIAYTRNGREIVVLNPKKVSKEKLKQLKKG